MTKRLTALLAALLAVFAIAVAGCGSATNDYRGKVSDIQKKYFTDLEKYSTDFSSKMASDPQGAATSLDQLASTAQKLSDEIKAVKPPSDKQALADQLVGAYSTLAKAAQDLKTAVAANDTAGLQTALDEFNKAQQDESSAVDAFNAAK